MNQEVVIYSTQFCPFCMRARQLLDSKSVEYIEFDINAEPQLRAEMMSKSGRRTVPQIWIGQTHVGGFDDLAALERQGKLDELLNQVS